MLSKYVCLSLSCAALLAGCGEPANNWKERVPVTGVVQMNGKPAEGVKLTFHPKGGMDQAEPTKSSAMSDAEGKFSASTYEVGDGAPIGEYDITLTWPVLNTISMSFDGDKLKGRYATPKKSKLTVNVESGKPIDLGVIELK